MNDLVFTCPACRKPLVVEVKAAGSRIECPLCRSGVKVPEVKTAHITGKSGGRILHVDEGRLESQVIDLLYDVHESSESLLRKAHEHDHQTSLIQGTLALARERAEVIYRHVEPMHYKQGPSESVQIPESWTPVPKQSFWKPLTLGFGMIAFLLALALSMMAG